MTFGMKDDVSVAVVDVDSSFRLVAALVKSSAVIDASKVFSSFHATIRRE